MTLSNLTDYLNGLSEDKPHNAIVTIRGGDIALTTDLIPLDEDEVYISTLEELDNLCGLADKPMTEEDVSEVVLALSSADD